MKTISIVLETEKPRVGEVKITGFVQKNGISIQEILSDYSPAAGLSMKIQAVHMMTGINPLL
jgi:hypothetical protein